MSACITELTEKEFRQQALLTADNSSATFNHSLYKQGLTFSLPMKKQALRYCQKLIEENLSSLLVQSSYCFTVWAEKNVNSSTVEQSDIQESSVTSTPENITQKVPTKKITRLYRGQTYEVEIPDYSAISKQMQTKPKTRRKYRGQYID